MLRFCVALMVVLVCSASADPLFGKPAAADEFSEYDAVEDGEGRIFFTSNGGFSLTNNTVDLGALLAAALLGLLFALTLGPALFGAQNSNTGYGYAQSSQGYGSNHFYARSDKNVPESELAQQLVLLAEAFKRYEVQDRNCQLFVACEASQTDKHAENGPLATSVYQIMRKMKKHGRRQVHSQDAYVASLLDAFVHGENAARSASTANKDACGNIKRKCFEEKK